MGAKAKKKSVTVFRIVAAAFAVLLVVSAVMLVRELRQSKKEAQTFSELAALRLPRDETSPRASTKPSKSPASTPTPTSASEPTVIEVHISLMTPTATFTAGESTAAGDPTAEEPGEEHPTEASPTEDQPTEEQPTEETPADPTPLQRYLPLYELNPDFFGWITIEDTRIDYPVMYNARNPLAYLGHDFYGQFSYAGVPFLDSDCDPNGNFYLVYGHRMNDGSMFADLVKYEESDFWETHTTFSFDTLYEERTYEVVLAIKARVLNREERNGFRYYDYTSLDTEAEFDDYIEQAKELSCYDTGVDVTYGDELLVLSTCYHYTTNGRFVLIAKRITD